MKINFKNTVLILLIISLSSINFIFPHSIFLNSELERDVNLNVPSTAAFDNINYEWNRTWGGIEDERMSDVAFDSLENIYIVGTTNGFGAVYRNVFLIKYDSSGKQLWNQTWGWSAHQVAAISIDSSDYIYITGYSLATPAYRDIFILKYDTMGNKIWNTTLEMFTHTSSPLRWPIDILFDSKDNFYVVVNQHKASDQYNAFLLKFDSFGESLWIREIGEFSIEEASAMAIDSLDNIYITGLRVDLSQSLYHDIFLDKYDCFGNLIFNISWSGGDNEYGRSISIDIHGDIYLYGDTYSFGSGDSDVCLVKYNDSGTQLWNQTWGGSNYEYGYKMGLDSQQNIYLTGITKSFGEGLWDTFLIKFNPSGDLQWEAIWSGLEDDQCGISIAFDPLDNIYITGGTKSFGEGDYDAVLIKYDQMGNQCWNLTWGGIQYDCAGFIGLLSSEEIYLAGITGSFGAGIYDIFLIKYKFEHKETIPAEWFITWGGGASDEGQAVAIDSLGDIYLAGFCSSFGEGVDDLCLVKYDDSGIQLWNRTLGGFSSDHCYAMDLDSLGNIYIGGYTGSFSQGTSRDMILAKYTSSGDLDWYRTWGSSDNYDGCFGITVDSSDKIYVAGTTDVDPSESINYDYFLIKYNSEGDILWEEIWGTDNIETCSGISLDAVGNIYVAGDAYNPGMKYDFNVVKFDASGNYQWDTSWGGNDDDKCEDIAIDSDGNIYLGGYTYSYGAGVTDACLVKFDNSGALQWYTTWGWDYIDFGKSVEIASGDNIYLAGSTVGSEGKAPYDMCLISFNSMGEEQWNTTWGGSNSDECNDIALDSSEDIYLAGTTTSFGIGKRNMCLVKFNIEKEEKPPEEQIEDLIGIVEDPTQIPTIDFDGKNDNTKENRRNAFLNKLNSILNEIQIAETSSDPLVVQTAYENALDELYSLLAKTDGCFERGTPDGKGSHFTPDWITTCESQSLIDPLIRGLIGDFEKILGY
ncbi:MAG: hypothetical protein EU531_03370 [Promethearchaeota archaeon]|nr:MAG: hypothetical protein EU531_03370 [Candidatus Lokiarchaeota archaeon]